MRSVWLAWALWLLCGCVGTPVPQPPALDPPDARRIGPEATSTDVVLVGEPGAADPTTTLWIVPLDRAIDPLVVPVEADGSFRTSLSVGDGEELRIQARAGEDRSRPVDVRMPVRAEIVRPTEGCLSIEPEIRVDGAGASTAVTLTVDNGCTAEARVAMLPLRRPSRAWSVTEPTPVVVAPGATAGVALTFAPDAPGLHEEILFLQIESPEADRRPVTLSGAAP